MSRQSVKLRELTPEDEKGFFEGMKLWEGESPHWYSFSWEEGMSFQEYLDILYKERHEIDLPEGRVKHAMLYGFLEDGTIIGRVSVRLKLNDYLLARGGNMGYSVAPKYRKQGYAHEMVAQAIEFCKSEGLEKVLITCAVSNKPSVKIIEKIGGVLENEVWDEEHGENIYRYWVDL